MFKILPHTADIALALEAETLERLFIEAAKGWKYLVFENAEITGEAIREVVLEAVDMTDLMVCWLGELNFFLETHCWVFDTVQSLLLTSGKSHCRLSARISGAPLDPQRHYIYNDIKAVTYHQLDIKYQMGKYQTRVIFDV